MVNTMSIKFNFKKLHEVRNHKPVFPPLSSGTGIVRPFGDFPSKKNLNPSKKKDFRPFFSGEQTWLPSRWDRDSPDCYWKWKKCPDFPISSWKRPESFEIVYIGSRTVAPWKTIITFILTDRFQFCFFISVPYMCLYVLLKVRCDQ